MLSVKIITDPYLMKEEPYLIFKPRSKKRRIQKKARKLYTRHRHVPDVEHVYHIQSMNAIACRPAMEAIIRESLRTGTAMYQISCR